MNTQRPLILIANDDGIQAAGVHRLIDYVADLGDIVCVCPEDARSGSSMALTVNGILRVTQHPDYMGARMFSCNGTPVDCVKLAWHTILDRRPDLMLAGINHGSNAAINVLYSGTMGAVMEGCAFGIPSVGYSLTNHSPEADITGCRPFVERITRAVLAKGLPDGVCLNVNVPDTPVAPTEMRICRQCRGNWSDEYVPYTDPFGRKFYMLAGHFENAEPDAPDTDEFALHHGMVSVVPTLLDRTAPLVSLKNLGL